jgi:hypothetical protein
MRYRAGRSVGENIMRDSDVLRLSSLSRGLIFLFVLPILILTFTASAFAQTPLGPAASTALPAPPRPPSTQSLKEDWRAGMAKVPLPKKGCFTSTYPSTEWQEVPCTAAPARPYPPARGPRPNTVGNGNDVSAQATTGLISTAVGSFDSVTGVTSESGYVGGVPPAQPNTFSLQLNSNFFTTSTCSGAANPSTCQGWQQFVYSNAGFAFMQYWLLNYARTCPTGWNTSGTDCWKNGSNAASVPVQTIANLGNLSLLGEANLGELDTIIMATGSDLYAAQNEDNVVNLALGWQKAEFNIVGDCCGSQANFNSGSTIVVRTGVDYGSPNAPSCFGEGFTGETNNLRFASAPAAKRGTSPAIVFTESSSGAVSPCASATGVASGELTDTHDFNGDGMSDILWRDTSGDVVMWLMNGGTIASSVFVGNLPTTWSIAGQRDFYGIGKSGILWRDTSGDVAIWQMNGGTITSNVSVATVPTTWSIAGTGDFNSDGMGDILWRVTTTGEVGIWLMNGGTIASSVSVAIVPTTWSIAGSSGNTIFWRDSSGDVVIWQMNGGTITSSVFVATVPTTWSIAGTGDFNGDGVEDILWHNTSGNVVIWLINSNGSIASSVLVGNVPTNWSIVETGDFYGIGKSGILWRDTSGDLAIWEMNGATIASSVYVATVPTTWSIQGTGAD